MSDLQNELLRAGLISQEEYERGSREVHEEQIHRDWTKRHLQVDGWYRGNYAVHVRRHRKLGKHCTVIDTAFPLMNALIGMQEVKKVDFGIIHGKWDGAPAALYVVPKGKRLRLLVTDPHVVQVIHVTPRSQAHAEVVMSALRQLGDHYGLTVHEESSG